MSSSRLHQADDKFAPCNFQVLALEYNMEDPKHFVGLCGLFNIGMFIIISLYTLVGIFGYLKYGSEVKASLTLNLPQNEKLVGIYYIIS